MSEIIHQSKNYDQFELLDFNRDVRNTKPTRKLELSMKKHGFKSAHPLDVIKNGNGKLKIKCGHHRFTIAKKLGIPVKFVISKDDMTIYEIEGTKNRWSYQNYLESHVRQGHKAYIAVEKYHEKTGISMSACISMLAGDSAGSGNHCEKFKTGRYKLGKQVHANTVGGIIVYCSRIDLVCATHTNFVRAISKIVWVQKVDIVTLRHKLKTHKASVETQPNVNAYIEMIESLYNRRNRNGLPLAFLANEAAKNRNAVERRSV